MDGSADLTIGDLHHGDWRVLVVEGELDMYSRSMLIDRITSSVTGPARLAVDVTNVRFVDSSGLATIVGASRHVQSGGGTFTLIAPPGSAVERMLALTGLSELIRPVADRTGL
jgi:anti-sigma B factor antagonist